MREKSHQANALPKLKLTAKYEAGHLIRESCGEIFRPKHIGINEGHKMSRPKALRFRNNILELQKGMFAGPIAQPRELYST